MTSVRCPICEQKLTSEDRDGLSDAIRGHLSDEHDIEVQEHSARFAGAADEGGREAAAPAAEEREGGRLHRAEIRREEQFWAPEAGTDVPPRPHGVGDWVKKGLGAVPDTGGRSEWATGEGYPTMMDRERDRASQKESSGGAPLPAKPWPEGVLESREVGWVRCPMCSAPLHGIDEEALSENLREHMASDHQIVRRAAMPPI